MSVGYTIACLHVHMYYMYLCVFHEGLNITEVAHDYNTQLKTYITQELKLVNSFDTWHGMCISAVQATWTHFCVFVSQVPRM